MGSQIPHTTLPIVAPCPITYNPKLLQALATKTGETKKHFQLRSDLRGSKNEHTSPYATPKKRRRPPHGPRRGTAPPPPPPAVARGSSAPLAARTASDSSGSCTRASKSCGRGTDSLARAGGGGRGSGPDMGGGDLLAVGVQFPLYYKLNLF